MDKKRRVRTSSNSSSGIVTTTTSLCYIFSFVSINHFFTHPKHVASHHRSNKRRAAELVLVPEAALVVGLQHRGLGLAHRFPQSAGHVSGKSRLFKEGFGEFGLEESGDLVPKFAVPVHHQLRIIRKKQYVHKWGQEGGTKQCVMLVILFPRMLALFHATKAIKRRTKREWHKGLREDRKR